MLNGHALVPAGDLQFERARGVPDADARALDLQVPRRGLSSEQALGLFLTAS